MPLVLSKADLKVQILINLDYAQKIGGRNGGHAVELAKLLASELSQEERSQIANFNDLGKALDFERPIGGV